METPERSRTPELRASAKNDSRCAVIVGCGSLSNHCRCSSTSNSFTSGSGAAKFDLTDCPANDVWMELSGASSARVVALDKLGVHLSGGSSCHYKAGEHLQITETDVDRGASLRKL